jgi:superfamily II DNA or RNA helicase
MDFTNMPFDVISRLTYTTFEKDLEKPIIISTVQTFLSMLSRKREEFLIALNDANIGIFVADEVHTSVGAPTFSECSIHVPSKYTYGLSATPYRFDGNGDIITFHLGDIYSDEDSQGTMKANVSIILLDYGIDGSKSSKYIRWGGQFQRSRYLNLLKKSQPFMDLVQALMDKLKFDRNVLLIAERIKLIDLPIIGVDMESASIAQVATAFKKRFVVLRVVSDIIGMEKQVNSFDKLVSESSAKVAKVIKELI